MTMYSKLTNLVAETKPREVLILTLINSIDKDPSITSLHISQHIKSTHPCRVIEDLMTMHAIMDKDGVVTSKITIPDADTVKKVGEAELIIGIIDKDVHVFKGNIEGSPSLL